MQRPAGLRGEERQKRSLGLKKVLARPVPVIALAPPNLLNVWVVLALLRSLVPDELTGVLRVAIDSSPRQHG